MVAELPVTSRNPYLPPLCRSLARRHCPLPTCQPWTEHPLSDGLPHLPIPVLGCTSCAGVLDRPSLAQCTIQYHCPTPTPPGQAIPKATVSHGTIPTDLHYTNVLCIRMAPQHDCGLDLLPSLELSSTRDFIVSDEFTLVQTNLWHHSAILE